ncbi:hypothetical protein BT93_L1191 [Corymbia citriodora subsp. variegata]|uniref:Uncharacterized protein n=1 Tax=Corymbia citriodora subsp. variegata TaxID=360336 RepID=A0A8T0CNE9_CORYI|nr:hypothetical protein BT93_L1191 [Corymbia citriodora subsp. variegata]
MRKVAFGGRGIPRKRDLSVSWKVIENQNQTRFESGEWKKKLENQKDVGFGDLEEEQEASDAHKGTTIHTLGHPFIMGPKAIHS